MLSRFRERGAFAALALSTICIGLVVHRFGTALPPAMRDVTGDALWAMMIFWLIGVVVPEKPVVVRGALALAICWLVEFSQLYHAQSLDDFRATTIGHLVLGSDFGLRDLAAYALGVFAALGLELAARRNPIQNGSITAR